MQEISNFMDESKPLKFASGSGSFHFLTERTRPGEGGDEAAVDAGLMDAFHCARQRLSTALDDHWGRVFSGSWLRHLDTVLVDDLRSVRSYQVSLYPCIQFCDSFLCFLRHCELA